MNKKLTIVELTRAKNSRLYGVMLSLICLLTAIGVGSEPVYGQTYQGGIRGAVRDITGALVIGVEMTLVNEATNISRATTTNGDGEYAFTNVLPGSYVLTASRTGYKKYENKGIGIGTQIFITLDLTLEVGQTTEQILVTGEAPVLENSNSSVSTLLDKKTIETLPTPARNVFFLSVMTPNVVPTGDPQFVRQQDQSNSSLLSLGGGPRRANNYTLDGVPITDLQNRAVFIPNIEATQEVKVQVNTYDAEMGRTGGGVFNATGKSGSNDWHGSGLIQNRPSFGAARLYFQRVNDEPKPDTYYYLFGGSFGGPIIKNRTFFFATTENYKTKTSRNAILTLPTADELAGNFSDSGVTIYDPRTGAPFPGNIIPGNRINPVAKAIGQYFPKPAAGTNQLSSTAELIDRALQLTGKVEHRWKENFTSTGMYAWYDSKEPESRFYGKNLGDNPGDPGEGALFRTVHMIAVNNTWLANSNTVVAFRYGYTQFVDDDIPNQFDPATLGFSQNYTAAIPYKKFPRISISGYGSQDFDTFGDRDPQDTSYYGHNFNASLSRLIGHHTLKMGGEFRIIGMKLFARGQPSGRFSFTSRFTANPNAVEGDPVTGSSLASFLLGYPESGDIAVGAPNDFYINYFGGFVHDDWRLLPNLTLNLGLRYEFEQGLQERNNGFTVGFDRDRTFPVQVAFPAPVGPRELKGGLMYAGIDGYPTHQSDPSKTKFAPRVGLAWSINQKLVLRTGYGIFYAPNQYAFPSESRLGTLGFTGVTTMFTSPDGSVPCNIGQANECTLTNPFPGGIQQPTGNSLRLLTGAGGDINFVDQFRKSAYIHQFSLDFQFELPKQMVVKVGYVGARGENLLVGGTGSNTVNINQLDPKYLSMGSALTSEVTNPFRGNPVFGNLAEPATIPLGQLLRPYPQFGDIFAHQVSDGFSRYNSLATTFEKRLSGGWGANINYTYSVRKDNIFGETNYFSNNSSSAAAPINTYDLRSEYGPSIIDAPHRLNIAGVYELPIGKGRRLVNRGGIVNTLIGGWSLAAIASYQSGFPAVLFQESNLPTFFGAFQRPNVVPGVDPRTDGGTIERLINWFNPAAWTPAAPFTLGNAPRADTRVRTPFKTNWDLAFQKNQRLTERFTLQLRAEMINVFNNPNFLGPVTNLSTGRFGEVGQVGGFPRLLQVMARMQF
jgi:trimeric autotransporter adhesin